jgi:mRNA interferase YafQ
MRRIEKTSQFKKDHRRELKGSHRDILDDDLAYILRFLVNNRPLPGKYRDHVLSGNWKYCRDCHIKPDLILIYRRPNDEVLQLVRLGSHSELGL